MGKGIGVLISFDAVVLIILTFATLSQTLFGVGVLLWGTPALLLYGYNFPDALSLVLPISLAISGLQVWSGRNEINRPLVRKFILFASPTLVLSLIYVFTFDTSIRLLISGALFLGVVVKVIRNKINVRTKLFNKYVDGLCIGIIGAIHGMSNLGGSLLVLRVSFSTANQFDYRPTVALVYLVFASIQLTTLYSLQISTFQNVHYAAFAIVLYFIFNRFIFLRINQQKFEICNNILIMCMAALLAAQHYDLIQ